MNYAVTDLYFLFLAHEGFADVGIVSVLERRPANQCRPIGDGLLARSQGKIFAGWEYRSGGADRTHRRHINMLRRQRDERAGRSGVRVDKCVGRNGGMVERARDLLRAVET